MATMRSFVLSHQVRARARWVPLLVGFAVLLQVVIRKPAPPPEGFEEAAWQMVHSAQRLAPGDTSSMRRFSSPAATLAGWHRLPGDSGYAFLYEVLLDSARLLIGATVSQVEGRVSASPSEVSILPAPLAEIHRFRLLGRSYKHYIVLLVAALSLTVSIAAATAVAGRGWTIGWQLLPFLCTHGIAFNWTSGAIFGGTPLTPLAAELWRYWPSGPWIVTLSLPVGALFVWLRLLKERSGDVPSAEPAGRLMRAKHKIGARKWLSVLRADRDQA